MLLLALILFGCASLAIPFVTTAVEIMINRLIAGIGLGAAAPLAITLLNCAGKERPSAFVISAVWIGIAVGGCLAALFSYFVVPAYGWRSIFFSGGVLPMFVAPFVYGVVSKPGRVQRDTTAIQSRLADLLRAGRARATLSPAAIFFFGYVTTSIIIFWLPTILTHRTLRR